MFLRYMKLTRGPRLSRVAHVLARCLQLSPYVSARDTWQACVASRSVCFACVNLNSKHGSESFAEFSVFLNLSRQNRAAIEDTEFKGRF